MKVDREGIDAFKKACLPLLLPSEESTPVAPRAPARGRRPVAPAATSGVAAFGQYVQENDTKSLFEVEVTFVLQDHKPVHTGAVISIGSLGILASACIETAHTGPLRR